MYGSNSVAVAQQCADVLLLIRIDSKTCSNHSQRIAASQELCAALCEQVLNGLAYLHDQQAHASHMSTHKTARVYRNVQMIRSDPMTSVPNWFCIIVVSFCETQSLQISGDTKVQPWHRGWVCSTHSRWSMCWISNVNTYTAHMQSWVVHFFWIRFEINPLPGFHRFSRVWCVFAKRQVNL